MLILRTRNKKSPKVVVDLFKGDSGPQFNLKFSDISTPKYLLWFFFCTERLKIMEARLPVAEVRNIARPRISYLYALTTRNNIPTYIYPALR